MKKLIVVAIVAVVLAPVLVDLALWIQYVASYEGMCGPHATDIPARACTFHEYLSDYLADPFAIVGLFVLDALVFVAAGILAGVALAVVLSVRDFRAAESHARWDARDLRHRSR